MAESVLDHGAVGDGRQDDTRAFIEAANAAGPGGTVEIPAPSAYYLVDAGGSTAFQMPGGGWDNQTWVGIDGYDATEIRMKGGQGSYHFMFEAKDGQGDFTVKQLTFDMNKGAMNSDGWASQVFHIDNASGTLTARDCIFKNTMSAAIDINTAMNVDVQYCGFDDIGWQDPNDGKAAHGVTLTPDGPITADIKHCYFDGMSGAAHKIGGESGRDWVTATYENCWSSAPRMAKIDPDNRITTFKNCYHQMQDSTSYPDDVQDGIAANVDGYDMGDLIIDNVRLSGPFNGPGVNISATFSNIEVRDLYMSDADQYDTKAPGTDAARGFINVYPANYLNCTVMSVDGVGSNDDGGALYIDSGSTGDLGEVRHQQTGGIGEDGGISVVDNGGGSMLDPVVPTKSDVGPRASDGTDSQYGGYTLPEAGQADWHVPLNQNFQDIEADIKDLAARLDNLEGN